VDPSRIHGFGSDGGGAKRWRCPAGHFLHPSRRSADSAADALAAVAAADDSGCCGCGGCGRTPLRGEAVMECRRCCWYLCASCHPREESRAYGSFWDVVTIFMEAAQVDIRDAAADFEEFMADLGAPLSCGGAGIAELERAELQLEESDTVTQDAASETICPSTPRAVVAVALAPGPGPLLLGGGGVAAVRNEKVHLIAAQRMACLEPEEVVSATPPLPAVPSSAARAAEAQDAAACFEPLFEPGDADAADGLGCARPSALSPRRSCAAAHAVDNGLSIAFGQQVSFVAAA